MRWIDIIFSLVVGAWLTICAITVATLAVAAFGL